MAGETQDKPPRRRKGLRWLALGLVAVVALASGGALYANSWLSGMEAGLPPTPDVATMPVSTEVVDRNGQLLRPFTTPDGRWRLPVGLDDVDRRFIDMLIGYEDRRFTEHHGVDYRAILRAAGQFALAGGHAVSGGSTLTMQVARLIDGSPTKTAGAKKVAARRA